MSNSKTFNNTVATSGIKPEINQNGVAWSDYNNDGYQDFLLVTSRVNLKLYRNNGDGTFTDDTNKSGLPYKFPYSNGAFGDYDNDGCSDLYLSSKESDNLFHNNCDGTFTDVSLKAGIKDELYGLGISWVDYNRDGFLDIYVVNQGMGTDDKWNTEPNILYRNNGDGTFTNFTKIAGVSGYASCPNLEHDYDYLRRRIPAFKKSFQSIWADMNGDGWPDLYVTNDATFDVFYLNKGNGTFAESTYNSGLCSIHTSGMGIVAGDFDNDGNLDFYLTNSGANSLYHNDGYGKFTEVAKSSGVADLGNGWGTEFLDYDNDGDLDILVVNGTWKDPIGTRVRKQDPSSKMYDTRPFNRMYENVGGGKYIDATIKLGLEMDLEKNNMATAAADYNNDGFVDFYIAVVDHFKKISGYLYRNTPNGNHWLTVKLIGTKSNRDGVGAKIIIKSGGKTQVREVVSGSSYLGQSSLWQTFGLGQNKSVEEVTIKWPSGVTQALTNINPDATLTVTEKR